MVELPEEELVPLSSSSLTDEELHEIASKALFRDDANAAYLLYNHYTYAARDYEKAYFWCFKAIELKHPKLTSVSLENAEKNIEAQYSIESYEGESVELREILPK